MSLRDVYADAWRKRKGIGEGWIVNLEPTYNLSLGAVGVVSDGAFAPETTLERRGVAGLDVDANQKRGDTPWQFQSNDGINVQVGSAGNTTGAAAAIAHGAWDVSVEFGSEAGVSIHGLAQWWNAYADLGVVRAKIVEAASHGQLHKGESIVVTQHLTGPGVVFTAIGGNASIRASASADLAPGTVPPVASLAAKLSLVKSSAGAQFQTFDDRSVLAARVLYLGRRGFFWWRDFVAYGAVEVDLDQVEETVLDPVESDHGYFALL